jgi:CelD/BcsL family acetyltransferase involved in cellulose biosynthesis
MIDVEVCAPEDLSAEQCAAWCRIMDDHQPLNTPFLAPEMVRLASRVRGGVKVGVLLRKGHTIGFFPFQQISSTVAEPVLGGISEFHGVVIDHHEEYTATELLEGCGLKAWRFHHLVDAQLPLENYQWGHSTSPAIDLGCGFDDYRRERKQSQSRLVEQILRKSRKLEREVGPLRLEHHSRDPHLWESLVRWKSQQHDETGVLPVLQISWVAKLMAEIRDHRSDVCGGLMSALYAGEQLVAVHLGLRRGGVLHVWFPTYAREFQSYSPGLVLLMELARTGDDLKIDRIELGKGPERYKTSLANRLGSVAEGTVSTSVVETYLRRKWYDTKVRMRSSRMQVPFEAAAAATRRFRQRMAMRSSRRDRR